MRLLLSLLALLALLSSIEANTTSKRRDSIESFAAAEKYFFDLSRSSLPPSTRTPFDATLVATMTLLFGISSIYASSVNELHSILRDTVAPKTHTTSIASYCRQYPDNSGIDSLPAGFITYMCDMVTRSILDPPEDAPSPIYTIEGALRPDSPTSSSALNRVLNDIKRYTDDTLAARSNLQAPNRRKPALHTRINLVLSNLKITPDSLRKDLRLILVSFIREMMIFTRRPTETNNLRNRKVNILSAIVSVLRALSVDPGSFTYSVQCIFDPSFDPTADTTLSQTIARFTRGIYHSPSAPTASKAGKDATIAKAKVTFGYGAAPITSKADSGAIIAKAKMIFGYGTVPTETKADVVTVLGQSTPAIVARPSISRRKSFGRSHKSRIPRPHSASVSSTSAFTTSTGRTSIISDPYKDPPHFPASLRSTKTPSVGWRN